MKMNQKVKHNEGLCQGRKGSEGSSCSGVWRMSWQRRLLILVLIAMTHTACKMYMDHNRFSYLNKVPAMAKADADSLRKLFSVFSEERMITANELVEQEVSADSVGASDAELIREDSKISEIQQVLMANHPELTLKFRQHTSLAKAERSNSVFLWALLMIVCILLLIVFLFATLNEGGDSCSGCLLLLILGLIAGLVALLS